MMLRLPKGMRIPSLWSLLSAVLILLAGCSSHWENDSNEALSPLAERPRVPPDADLQLVSFDDDRRDGVASDEPSQEGPSVKLAAHRASTVAPNWGQPGFVLFLTGRQHGYIEPCGCTGLENANGGLTRRFSLLKQLRDRGWEVIALDAGNQVGRFGKQAEIKFQRTTDILARMGYTAVGFGPDDLRLSLDGLLAPITEAGFFVSANVDLLGLNVTHKTVQARGHRIGITAILGLQEQKKINRENSEVGLSDPRSALQKVLPQLQAEGCDFRVLLAHASLEETRELVGKFPDVFDVVVTAGGAGEPTLEPERVQGSKSRIVQVGTKGMYVGLIGVFDDAQRSVRYSRIVLDARLPDSPEVLEIFADYQRQLEILGLEGLGLRPVKHPTGRQFVGNAMCGDCHTTAFEIFENTPHMHATETLVHPPNERSAIPRHFDPECLSCHVIGWNPQGYFPYESGYLQLSQTALHSNGCENCHGPGSAHVAAENGDVDVSDEDTEKLRSEMRVTLEESKEKACYECHDLDNSPTFDFDSYWEEVEHYGKD